MTRVLGSLCAVAAVAAMTPAAATAESGRLADFTLQLSSRAPSAPTGFSVHLLLHRANDPNAKPAALRSAVLSLPPGLRFDTSAVPECTASDAEFHALGSDACPHESELTVGKLVGITGFGPPVDPLVGDDHVFDGPSQLIEVITTPGSPASPAFDRLTIAGTTLTAHPPMTPGGPPDGETVVRSIDFQVPPRTDGGKSLVTTPPTCPVSGRWTTTGTFLFADGTSDTVMSATPCSATSRTSDVGAPRLRLSVRPHNARAGVLSRLSFLIRGSDGRCGAGARVHVGRRTVHADARGRASVAIRFHRAGLRRVRAVQRGCRPALARIRVRSQALKRSAR